LPSILSVGQESTVLLGLLQASAFFAAALTVIPQRAPLVDGLAYGAATISPAVMLGVERGNVDMTLFGVIVLAVLLLRRGRSGPYISSGLVLFAAILKLFPIFAAGVLVRQRPRAALISCGSVLGVFILYATATLEDIRTIALVVPQINAHSYGVRVVGDWLASSLGGLHGQAWGLLVASSLVAVGAIFRKQVRQWLPALALGPGRTRERDFLWAGAPVFLLTFALFRSFDYRLVFLLMTIPLLLRWARQGHVVALGTLTFVVATLWLPGAWRIVGADAAARLVALSGICTFGGLVAALVATAPVSSRAHERV
jgi:hypothetical protein